MKDRKRGRQNGQKVVSRGCRREGKQRQGADRQRRGGGLHSVRQIMLQGWGHLYTHTDL